VITALAAVVASVLGPIPIDPGLPVAVLVNRTPATVEPVPGDCDSFHDVAVAAGWDEQDWPTVEYILHRESHCLPWAVNRRSGSTGLMQVMPSNLRRLGYTRADALDAATNLAIGHELCQEWVDVGRSCYRPWWTGRWRP
jgi:hypothetical protein